MWKPLLHCPSPTSFQMDPNRFKRQLNRMRNPGLPSYLALTQRWLTGLLEEACLGKTSMEGWDLTPWSDISGLWSGCPGPGRLRVGDRQSQTRANWTIPLMLIFYRDLTTSMKNFFSIPNLSEGVLVQNLRHLEKQVSWYETPNQGCS